MTIWHTIQQRAVRWMGVAVVLLAMGARGDTVYHVAVSGKPDGDGTSERPFASVGQARDAIRTLKKKAPLAGPVTVQVHGGVYAMKEPVVFGPEDSGTSGAPIIYAAAAGEQPMLHGGRRIAGWRKHTERIWVVDVPEVARGEWRFRQLFIDGQQRRRARLPNDGFYKVASCPEGTPKTVNYHKDCQVFGFKPGDIRADWTNLNDVEVIVYHFWTDSHLPIRSVDTQSNLVTFAHKAGKVFTDDFTENGARYIVENVFEGLDAPGEWYLNRQSGQLFYYPMAGEDMARVECVAPVAPALLRFEGDPVNRRWVEHLHFKGIAFEYSHFELPPGNSNDQQGSASVSASVTLRGARHVAFEHCRFARLGNWAIELMAGCSENRFVGNEISWVAAGGFRINGATERGHPLERTEGNVITDNSLQYYGQVFPSAVGILLMHTAGNTVAHNHIHHGGYTGISVGWVWGYQRSVSRDNLIEANHIHDIGGGLLSDMGGIYTLGIAPGTVVRGNVIHDVEANHYGGWGIYHDEGSSHLLVENNLVYRTKFAPFNIHFAKEVVVRNNIFAMGRLEQMSRGKVEPHKSVFFENNIVYWTSGGLLAQSWKDVPYTFHFHPKDGGGTKTVTNTFDMDWNLYWNPNQPLEKVSFAGGTFQQWQQRGKDTHSIYADPLFEAPERNDFRLKADSPALGLGFKPFDTSKVGPRVTPGTGKSLAQKR